MAVLWVCAECGTNNVNKSSTCMVCHAAKGVPAEPKPEPKPRPSPAPSRSGTAKSRVRTSPSSARGPITTAPPPGPRPPAVRRPSRKDARAGSLATLSLATFVVPWQLGARLWRPRFGSDIPIPDKRVLWGLPTWEWIPDYFAGAGLIFLTLLVVFLWPPRARRRPRVYVVLAVAAWAGFFLAGKSQDIMEWSAKQAYLYSAIETSAIPKNCVTDPFRWNTAEGGNTYTWTLAESPDCKKLVAYRGWIEMWTSGDTGQPFMKGIGLYGNSLVAILSGTADTSSKLTVINLATGKNAWTFRCPGNGKITDAVFAGAQRLQSYSSVNGHSSYLYIACGKREYYFEASLKKKSFHE